MKYRKKPIVIEAWQWTGNFADAPTWIKEGAVSEDVNSLLRVVTLEGEMYASLGDFVIKGIQGEIYPCKPDIFIATYDPAE